MPSKQRKATEVVQFAKARAARVVAYVRVSSKGQDYATQRHAIESAHPEVGYWYQEKQSAKTTQRPELQRMLEDARAGRLDKLVVFRLDRLTRSGVADTFDVVKKLRDAGVTLVSVADRLTIKPGEEDVTSSVLVFAFGLAAKLEHAAIRDRIAGAIARKAAKGEGWGRPKKTDATTLERVQAMRAEGLSMEAIAKKMHVSRMTLYRALAAAK